MSAHGPVELDHVQQGVISQPRCLLFLEKRLQVPNKQATKAAQVAPVQPRGATRCLKMVRAVCLLSLEQESRFLGLWLHDGGIGVTWS